MIKNVCRTAPATLGLINTIHVLEMVKRTFQFHFYIRPFLGTKNSFYKKKLVSIPFFRDINMKVVWLSENYMEILDSFETEKKKKRTCINA